MLDVVGPVLGAFFALGTSLVREPARQRFNAILVAGSGANYPNGDLGFLEFPFIAVGTRSAGLRGISRWRTLRGNGLADGSTSARNPVAEGPDLVYTYG